MAVIWLVMAGLKNKLKFGSLNCQGFKSSQGVTELFKDIDILVVQEHWLYRSESQLFSSVADDALFVQYLLWRWSCHIGETIWRRGNFMAHKRVEGNISPVFTASDRLAAVRVGTSYGNVLVVAVYMPVDYGDSDSLDEYLSQLGCLESLLESDEYIGTVVLGHFNADLCQIKSRLARQLGTFVSESHLTVVGINDQARLDGLSTWHRSDFPAHSWIDYFVVSKSLERMVADFLRYLKMV